MHLILWRHAEAEDRHPSGDAARQLTAKGIAQASAMAAWLKPRLPAETIVIASPAKRTQQTAAALQLPIATEAGLFTDSAIDGHRAVLQHYLQTPPAALVVVGHQPTLGQLAALLLCGEAQYWSVRKGNIWWLQYREREGNAQTLLRAVIDPEWL